MNIDEERKKKDTEEERTDDDRMESPALNGVNLQTQEKTTSIAKEHRTE